MYTIGVVLMTDNNEDSLKNNDSEKNQRIESIESGLEKTQKIVIESSRKAVEATSKWTSEMADKAMEKKEQFIEHRQKKRSEFVDSLKEDEKYKKIIVDNEKLPPMVSLSVEEHEKLIGNIQSLESEIEQLRMGILNNAKSDDKESEINENSPDSESEYNDSGDKERGMSGEVNRSINQILVTLGFSVLWAVILIVIDFQLQDKGITFSGMGTKAVVWPLGTAIWTLFLLSSQSKAGTLLMMNWVNRIRTSIGVGLATTLSLMLTDGEMQAITNVWGWAMTIALCAFLLSGFFRGVFSSFRKLTGYKRN